MQTDEIREVLSRPLSRELLERDLTRLAYVAKDGTPRTIPIGFTWNGSAVVMCTSTNAPKLHSLRRNPLVEGIPDEYLQMNGSYQMTPEQRVEWEANVRSLYDGMVKIVVTPTWAKLIDFETTLPSPVEELLRRQAERQAA
jgi:hypothetical protein